MDTQPPANRPPSSSPAPGLADVDPKWSDDAFLDRLRASTDDEANGVLEQLNMAEDKSHMGQFFRLLTEYDSPLPEGMPAPVRAFLGATRAHRDAMVEDMDLERIRRSAELFRTFAPQACVVMLAASLPSGYSAPCLAEVLTISDELRRHPYRRLMGVVQMLVNISQGYEDLDDSRTLVTAQKLRLLHAGVRTIIPGVRPSYPETFGSPVNHEDMLATIMGFSYLVIEGIRRLRVDLTEEAAEDFWYSWRQYSRLMGIYPAGKPLSEEFVPQTYAEAATFYASYVRRHFENDPAKNPHGTMLAKRNLELMESLIPGWMRFLGLGFAPKIAMEHVLGAEAMARVGLKPVPGRGLLRRFLDFLLRTLEKKERAMPDFFSRVSSLVMQDMIEDALGGQVTFLIPRSVEDMQSLSRPEGPAIDRQAQLAALFGASRKPSNLPSEPQSPEGRP